MLTESLFIVTGGARGITARCAIELARRHRCRLLLLGRTRHEETEPAWAASCGEDAALKQRATVALAERGRSPLPREIQREVTAVIASREIGATLAAIGAAGGRAEYASVDVTDPASLRAVIESLGPDAPIAGVIHGAGILADKRIERKTSSDYDAVYSVKVTGLVNLLACLSTVQLARLHYLALFTSAAGFYGNAGQADYAAANELLNRIGVALQRRLPACRVLAFNWGPWRGGMVDQSYERALAQRGISLIPPDVGAKTFVDLLTGETNDRTAIQWVVGSPITTGAPAPDSTLRRHRTRRRLSLEGNPFLRHHVVGERAVLPFAFAAAWMANVCEQLNPGYRFFSIEDARVLKGIVFDEGLSKEYVLDVEDARKDAALGEVVLNAGIWSDGESGRQRRHYRGRLTLRREPPSPPLLETFDLSEGRGATPAAPLYTSGVLFHGPFFQGAERVLNADENGLTLRCRTRRVPAAALGQFAVQTFDPVLTDVNFQALGIWARLRYDAACLPLCAARGEHFRAAPPGEVTYTTLRVRSSSERAVTSDVYVHDATGRLYARVLGAEVTLSRRLNPLFVQAAGAMATQFALRVTG
jgi:NAD(P)-dependent dehydrogenase (short-subunit alcohol dehydrogenase family)